MIETRAPYGRHSAREHKLSTPTYYDVPPLKRSHFRWLIITYFFVGGMAGSAQLIATLFDARTHHDRSVVRTGRYLALVGSLLAPVLLIKDLHTPARWYNMLRIVRLTSPMSIGSWTLAGFGTLSGVLAACQFADDLGVFRFRRVASVLRWPAAGLGMLMSVYTGVLLSSTSTPLWSVAYRQLPAMFGATAFATAAAAISLVLSLARAPTSTLRPMNRIALVCALAQFVLGASTEREWKRRGVDGPLASPRLRLLHGPLAQGLGMGLPLLVHGYSALTGRPTRTASLLAAIAALVGAFAERAAIVLAGGASADRAADYFHVASPDRDA